MLPSNIKIISNYQLYSTPGPVPSQLCFVSRRMNEENVPLPAHHQETVPGPHHPPAWRRGRRRTSATTRPDRRRGRRLRRRCVTPVLLVWVQPRVCVTGRCEAALWWWRLTYWHTVQDSQYHLPHRPLHTGRHHPTLHSHTRQHSYRTEKQPGSHQLKP